MNHTPLFRSRTDRILGGVAGGIAQYAGVDSSLIRFVLIAMTFLAGGGILLYIIAWILIPEEPAVTRVDKQTGQDIYSRHEMHQSLGIAAILLGAFLLLVNLGIFNFVLLAKLWPILLIFLGLVALRRGHH